MTTGKNKYLIQSAVLCAVALTVMVLALLFGKPQIQAEFAPPAFDIRAQIGVPEVPENLGWTELDAKEFRVSLCGVVAPSNGTADIWLTNPGENDVWLKLRVLGSDGKILGETGLITPGQYVRTITLGEIPEAGTPIALKVMAYESETYYSAGSISVNTQIYETGQE